MAVLSASVPPEVKNISEVEQFSKLATVFLAFSIADRTSRPCEWMEDGLPKLFSRKGSITSKTFGSSGVVAALSK